MKNPYLTNKGFGLRCLRAQIALEKFGRDQLKRPYTRSFDNCFEMGDGNAVVWSLMHEATNGNDDLKRGIENMGKNVWPHWLDVYHRNDQPKLFEAIA